MNSYQQNDAAADVSNEPITPEEIMQETKALPPEIRAMLPKFPANVDRLKDILSMCRCHDSIGERKFIDLLLSKFKPVPYRSADYKEIAAFVVTTDEYKSTVLWSCHIDTVHKSSSPPRQVIEFDPATNIIYKRDNEPLGADDGAGIWLLMEMIDAGVPGTYIFHRGEEKGGIGSRIMASHHSAFIGGYTHAIAFDRCDTVSVITKQRGSRCCSEDFANHFCKMLGNDDDFYEQKPDPTGSFTDTANYTDLIGECTNVSIGYYSEHTGAEQLDLSYLLWLRDKMVAIDVDKLASVNVRKAGEKEPVVPYSGYYGGGMNSRDYGGFEFVGMYDDEQWWFKEQVGKTTVKKKRGKVTVVPPATPASVSSIRSGSSYTSRKVKSAEDVLNMKAFEVKNWVATASMWEIADLLISLALQVVFGKERK